MNTLTVILKMAERCNLNCSYCYFFNGKDPSYKDRPAYITEDNINKLIDFLSQGIDDLSIDKIIFGFHGGEPLLFGKKNFDALCENLTNKLSPKAKLGFSVQTNGLLLDEKWVNIFQKHKVDIGISIDGPKEIHDKYRVDHFGRGSYDRLIKKIKLLQSLKVRFGILSVINPKINANTLYNFFTQDLNIQSFDLLFPHLTYDETPEYSMEEFSNFVSDIFNVWTLNNKNVRIRIFISFLRQLLGGSRLLYGIGTINKKTLPLITVRSDGDLEPVTGLMYTDPETVSRTGGNIHNTTLKDFINLPIFHELEEAQNTSPAKCAECCWEKICGGGHIIDRFSTEKRFDNPSTYCSVMQNMYAHMSKYLLDSGIRELTIKKSLGL